MSFIVKAPLKLFRFKPKGVKLKRGDVRNLKFKRNKRHRTREAVADRLFHTNKTPVFTDQTPEEAEGPPCRDGDCSNIRL